MRKSPGAVAEIGIESEQSCCVPRVTPATETEVVPADAANDPPQVFVAAGDAATWSPAGRSRRNPMFVFVTSVLRLKRNI